MAVFKKKIEGGNDLAPGFICYQSLFSCERRIQAGDKLAGRHGNKV